MTDAPHPPLYVVQFEPRQQYLWARVSGAQATFPVSIRYWNEIASECRTRGYKRLLVMENFSAALSLVEVFQVSARLPDIIRGIRVAMVDEHLADLAEKKFSENVAVNRGAFARVFRDETSADAWLNA